MKKILRWGFILIATPVSLLLGILTLVSLLGITINLDRVRPMVEEGVSAALGRQVAITGSVELLPTLTPRLEVQGLRIDNPEGWGNPDFVVVKLVRIQLGLLDLLRKKISIGEITAEGVSVYLESRKDSINNWSFSSLAEKKTIPANESSPEQESSGAMAFKAVDKLSLKTIEVIYKDVVLGKTVSFQLDELTGTASAGKSLVFHAEGSFQEQSYSFDLDAGALDSFRPKIQAWPLDISGTIAGTPLSAKGDLGYKNNEQQLLLDVSIGAVDVGRLLSWLQVVDNIKASTEDLSLHLQLKGESLNELISQSEFKFTMKGGILDLSAPDSDSEFLISRLDGNIGAKSGSPIEINLNGVIDTTPVSITIQGMPLVRYISDPGELPVEITLGAAGTEIGFKGSVDLPVDSKTFKLAMTLKGEKLDSLNELLGIDLPPLGPYSLDAQFAATSNGYDLSDLAIKVGGSDLIGSMSLNDKGERPEVALQFVSNVLQLDSFTLGDWSPEGKKGSAGNEDEPDEQEASVPSFLSPESLSRLNGTLSIEMKQVLSGKDTLGSGHLEFVLEDGRLSIAPLQLDLADGTAKLEFSFYPTAQEKEIHLGVLIDTLDIGILARRVKPESTMGGVLNLDIVLDSKAPELKDLMAYGNGHFDLAFVPVNFDSGIIDLWAINLLSALASEVDGEPKSIINCLVASFVMEDGLMQERAIFMDTTHMSIEGQANIDFKTEHLKLKMAPTAKRPEYFSLATPVNVKGSFDDFGVGINKLRLTTSLVSFLTSPVHVPLRRLFSGKRPADGEKACSAAWENRNIDTQAKLDLGD